jgi:DNA-binding SARP family transcriptional activator/tetratricopeptide (TPR) repeat protein
VTAVRLRLLGPVQLWAGDRAVDLGPARQRTVLAALAVDAGTPVSLETLIVRVWDEAPPPGARSGLYSYLTRIRRALAELEPAPGLHVRSGGYVLELDPEMVDLHQFRRLTDQARQHPDEQTRADLLESALALWAGPALADLASPWAAAVRERLGQLRIDALLAWAAVQLALGRPDAVVGPLRERMIEHPLVEPLAARLMQALHQQGRGAEALALYAGVRERLVDELGTEPGTELRRVHRAILRDEPSRPATTGGSAPTTGATTERPPNRAAGATAERPPTRAASSRAGADGRSASSRAGADGRSASSRAGADGRSASSRAGDPALDPAGAVVPMQLPAMPAAFAARVREVEALDALARHIDRRTTTVVVSALHGTAGVGKTTLALHWGHRNAHLFSDGQLYVNLRGFDPVGQAMDPADALRFLLESLGVPGATVPAELEARAALYRSKLAGRRVLVVLDNARDVAQVRPLLPGAPGCLVLITSRNQLTGLVVADGAIPVGLDLLTPAEARELLSRRIGAERAASDPDAIEEIITRCVGLPLALAVVAARAISRPQVSLAMLAADLRTVDSGLTALAGGDDAYTDVRAVFSWSYHALTPAAAELFRLFGVHPGPDVTLAALASMAARPADEVATLLSELVRANLIAETTPGRFGCHDLLRAYASDLARRLDADWLAEAANRRMLDHYLGTGNAAAMVLDPRRIPIDVAPAAPGVVPERIVDTDAATEWFAAERAVLLAAVDRAVDTGHDAHVWQLAWTLNRFLDFRGHWEEWTAVTEAAVAAAERLGDEEAESRTLRTLSVAYINSNQYEQGKKTLVRALELTTRMGDVLAQAFVHRFLAAAWGYQERHVEALEHSRESLALFEEAGNVIGRGLALNAVGWHRAQLGEHAEALEPVERALAIFRQLGDLNNEAHTLDSLGFIHHHLGRYAEAVVAFRGAIALNREVGNLRFEGTTLVKLGDTYLCLDDVAAARAAWTEAARILGQLGVPEADEPRSRLGSLA